MDRMPRQVHSARLPPAFGLFYNKIGKLDKKAAAAVGDCPANT